MQIQHVFHMFYDISLKIMHEFILHLNLEKLGRKGQVLRQGDKTKYCYLGSCCFETNKNINKEKHIYFIFND